MLLIVRDVAGVLPDPGRLLERGSVDQRCPLQLQVLVY